MSSDQPRVGSANAADASTAELVRDLARLVPQLVREEIALARVEVVDKAKHAGLGAGLFGAAGLGAMFGVGVLLAAAVLGLAEAMAAWLAALIVALVVLALAGIAALVGKRQVGRATPAAPTMAVDSVKVDVETVKESARR
jgi:hypothetical protein